MKKQKVIIRQDPDNEIPSEVIATAILNISDSMERINRGALNQKALVILISAHSRISQATVRQVLDSLSVLRSVYLRK